MIIGQTANLKIIVILLQFQFIFIIDFSDKI